MDHDYFNHEKAICETKKIGSNTRIWAFAHILVGAKIGSDCNICDGVFVENDVEIGNRVTIKCGVQIWDGITVEDDVFIGPNATFTNDMFPRSRQYPEKYLRTIIKKGASIGANATILPGIEIGTCAMVGAGAVITQSVPPHAIVIGNPARIIGHVGSDKKDTVIAPFGMTSANNETAVKDSEVKGVKLYILKEFLDIRGDRSVGEFARDFPFVPQHYSWVYSVPSEKINGQHAYKVCQQFLVCVNGACTVLVDDGRRRQEYLLDRPNKGIYLPAMIWGIQYKYSRDAVLLVLASQEYDENDCIKDYNEWLELIL